MPLLLEAPQANEISAEDWIAELVKIDGKAEIVDGRIVIEMPTGDKSGSAGDAIFVSLWNYVQRVKQGRAVGDNKGFLVQLPHRQTFSPDAAYYTGPPGVRNRKGFFPQAPDFAVEVRSENDYGPKMERQIAEKIADYFAAGTLAVWDMDLDAENVVTLHRPNQAPVGFKRGETAHAEPAVPGWTLNVDEIFAP